MEMKKILNALSYFSLFFAPFLFPIVVYFVATDHDVKYHAKRAFISHIIPALSAVILVIMFGVSVFVNSALSIGIIVLFLLVGLVDFIILVWNVIQGIKALIHSE